VLRITVDIFSGRPNPTWIIGSDDETYEVLTAVAKDSRIAHKVDSGYYGLGYRGIRIDIVRHEDAAELKLPTTFTITNGSGKNPMAGVEVAARLIERMTLWGDISLPEHSYTPIDDAMQKYLLDQLRRYPYEKPIRERDPRHEKPTGHRAPGQSPPLTVSDAACPTCDVELSPYDPSSWGIANSNICLNNNCYNYACNLHTMTFAQPGRWPPAYTYIHVNFAQLDAAALHDGLHRACDCLSSSEKTRHFVALAIKPEVPAASGSPSQPGDFHWYRKHNGNLWGHKVGSSPVSCKDYSGALITDPERCNSGDYTVFGGYYYVGRSVRIC